MAPNLVLLSHTTLLTMPSSTNPTHNSITPVPSAFGRFHRISVEISDKTIGVPIILLKREAPYRKALIAHHLL